MHLGKYRCSGKMVSCCLQLQNVLINYSLECRYFREIIEVFLKCFLNVQKNFLSIIAIVDIWLSPDPRSYTHISWNVLFPISNSETQKSWAQLFLIEAEMLYCYYRPYKKLTWWQSVYVKSLPGLSLSAFCVEASYEINASWTLQILYIEAERNLVPLTNWR